jgi:CYTH domain-containing protein
MGKEIEKKFLLGGLPAGLDNGVEILQGYLSTGDPEVRVRSKGSQFFVTRKGGEGFVRSEEEAEVSKEIFEILWPATNGARVEKVRYRLIGEDGLVWEIDKYDGHLSELFTAEVELPSEEVKPVMPKAIADVFVADVTTDKSYKNKALAVAGLPTRK